METTTELKTFLDSIGDGFKTVSEQVTKQAQRQSEMQRQLDALDLRGADRLVNNPITSGAVKKTMEECDSVSRLLKDRRGSAVIRFKDAAVAELMEVKTTITESGQGFATTGVLPFDRIPGITPEARQQLYVRNMLYSRPTTMALVDFVKVLTPMSIASPVPEASLKPENQLQFVSMSEKVRTLATWIPASKQILDDMQELMGFIQTSMPYYTNLAEELQLLSGDGTGENLHGLIPQATVFVPGSLPAGSTRIDVIGAVVGAIQTAKELTPTFAILHPSDWWGMKLLKNSLGNYILGDPQSTVQQRIFDLDVVPTTSIAKGTFLIGSGSPVASEIRDRQELVVEISTEHQDYFVRNLVAVRAEKRLALIVKRASSYVTGSFAGLS